VLELGILDCHPDLNNISFIVFDGDLFDVVEDRNSFLWFFPGLQLFVFLDDLIPIFQSLKVVLDLVLGEWELSKQT